VEIRRIVVGGQSSNSKQRDHISANEKLGMVVYTYHPSYLGNVNRRIVVLAAQGIKARPYLKIN
jgi:hypothetical protein